MQGAKTWRVNGLINHCGEIVAAGADRMGWFDMSTLKEPYRIEGKKTMGIELAEQLGWELPDVIFYPTGGGTGLIGMWKAFDELEKIGFIGSKRPKMIAVQAEGCAPMVKAFEAGEEHAPRVPTAAPSLETIDHQAYLAAYRQLRDALSGDSVPVQAMRGLLEHLILEAEGRSALPRASVAHPNPSIGDTSITFRVPVPGEVRLVIYDTLGRRVRSLLNGWRAVGVYEMRWDGRDDSGQYIASGIYLIRLITPDHLAARKIMLLK